MFSNYYIRELINNSCDYIVFGPRLLVKSRFRISIGFYLHLQVVLDKVL